MNWKQQIGLHGSSGFTAEFFSAYAALSTNETIEAVGEELSGLRAAFDTAPYRYCSTLADEFVRSLRAAHRSVLTPKELAELVPLRGAIAQLRDELAHRRDNPDRRRLVGEPSAKQGEVRGLARRVSELEQLIRSTELDDDDDSMPMEK